MKLATKKKIAESVKKTLAAKKRAARLAEKGFPASAGFPQEIDATLIKYYTEQEMLDLAWDLAKAIHERIGR